MWDTATEALTGKSLNGMIRPPGLQWSTLTIVASRRQSMGIAATSLPRQSRAPGSAPTASSARGVGPRMPGPQTNTRHLDAPRVTMADLTGASLWMLICDEPSILVSRLRARTGGVGACPSHDFVWLVDRGALIEHQYRDEERAS